MSKINVLLIQILSILLLVLPSCSLNPYDIPFIGWRLEVAAQRKHYQESLKEQETKKDTESTNQEKEQIEDIY